MNKLSLFSFPVTFIFLILACAPVIDTVDTGNSSGMATMNPDTLEALPIPMRLAFMSGHVRAGLALYRAGELEMAAPHLLHPVSEMHARERTGLLTLGFQPELFKNVSRSVEDAKPFSEIESLLEEVEIHLVTLREKAGGDPAAILAFLMRTTIDEYTIAITDGQITDLGEYQDAYGFCIVAREVASSLPEPKKELVSEKLEALGALWLQGPLPVINPTPVDAIADSAEKIMLHL